MKPILIFTFSFFLFPFFIKAQEEKNIKTDSIKLPSVKISRYGLRVGMDLFKFSKSFYDKNYKGIEFVGDYRITKKYYLAAEIGNENKTSLDNQLTTNSKGSYLKFGFDYNGYENWLDMENIISVGLRLGTSAFNQKLYNYKIFNPNSYWGESPDIQVNQNYNGLTATWIEVVAGIKVKVFNNVFVGFSFRLNELLYSSKINNLAIFYIPGFNRTYDGSFGVGFNYTVSYFFPLYKNKK